MSTTTTPVTFSGSSTYAADFQQVITRAVARATLPVTALQNAVTGFRSQQDALVSLSSTFSSLQNAIQAISSAASGSLQAQVSSSSALSATASAGALAGTYTVQVDSLGSSTTTLSKAGLVTVSNPAVANISSASAFTLTVNGTAHTLTPAGTSLDDLSTAINAAGDGVHATIVNIGSNSAPDYRLSVTSNNLGGDAIQLNDGSADLLNTLSPGTPTQYQINGSGVEVSSNSNTITLSPGLTVNLLQQTSAPVTVTVSNSFSGLQSALSSLVTAYNAASTALQQQRGESGGALQGQNIVYQLQNALAGLSLYANSNGSGSVSSLSDLGLTLDQSGTLSFNATKFSAADTTAVQQFLGNVSSGNGFLKTMNDNLNTYTDTLSGTFQTEYATINTQITRDNAQIATQQIQIDDLQKNLQQQLSAADAAIATFQSQTSYFQQLFTATYGSSSTSNQ